MRGPAATERQSQEDVAKILADAMQEERISFRPTSKGGSLSSSVRPLRSLHFRAKSKNMLAAHLAFRGFPDRECLRKVRPCPIRRGAPGCRTADTCAHIHICGTAGPCALGNAMSDVRLRIPPAPGAPPYGRRCANAGMHSSTEGDLIAHIGPSKSNSSDRKNAADRDLPRPEFRHDRSRRNRHAADTVWL